MVGVLAKIRTEHLRDTSITSRAICKVAFLRKNACPFGGAIWIIQGDLVIFLKVYVKNDLRLRNRKWTRGARCISKQTEYDRTGARRSVVG
jgi:hypothetical protein